MSFNKHPLPPRCIKTLAISIVAMGIIFSTATAQPAKGANKFLGNLSASGGSVNTVFLTYWNHITPETECKWASIENTRDYMNWTGADKVATYAKANKIQWTFHTLMTGGAYPGWMANLPQEDMLAEIEEWFNLVALRYPDVSMINVINDAHDQCTRSALPWKNALGGKGSTGCDWVIKAFKMARERWPKALLVLSDYNNIEYDTNVNWTVHLIDTLKKYNTPIDVIGCQAHDAYKFATSKIKANIDKIASTGLPVYISEYEIDQNNDSIQRKIMEEQFTMFWNHPKIIGVTYYGFIKGKTFSPYAGLMSSDGIERPALTWLKAFVQANPDPPNDFSTTNVMSHFKTVQQNEYKSAVSIEMQSGHRYYDLQGRVSEFTQFPDQTISSRRVANQCFIQHVETQNMLKNIVSH
jgi:endo-1,4-beta-xylanase